MGTSRLFMPLLTELGGLGDGFCYKYVAPNGAPRAQRRLFVDHPRLNGDSAGRTVTRAS